MHPIGCRVHPMAIRPRPDTCLHGSSSMRSNSCSYPVSMVVPVAIFERRVRAQSHASVPFLPVIACCICASPTRLRLFPPINTQCVRALTHPSAPFSTSYRLPRPRLDQWAHASNRDRDLCTLVVTSCRCPFHPHVYKPVCPPSLITLLLSILAFNYTCS
jgi:hypothetical protein